MSHTITAKAGPDSTFLFCSKVSLYHSTDNPIVVEDNDIRTGEAYAPTRTTNVESEIGTAQLQF